MGNYERLKAGGLFLCFFLSFQQPCSLPFFSASAPASAFSRSVSLLGSSQASSFPVCTSIYPRPGNQLFHCDSFAFPLYLRLRRPLGGKTMVQFHPFSLIFLTLSHTTERMSIMIFSYSEMSNIGRELLSFGLIRNRNKKTCGQ